MILINGECGNKIEVSDRGFQYGDGLFETLAVRNGNALFLEQHLERLKTGCERLNIACPSLALIRSEIQQLSNNHDRAVIKLILTRGSGGRGYRIPESATPLRVLSLHPDPAYPAGYRDEGINVRFCRTRTGLSPALAGLKHLNRLEQVLARSEWNDPSIQEGLMLDVDGHIVEGTMSNLFYCKNSRTYTPSLAFAGVNGIMRSIFVGLLGKHGHPVEETRPCPKDLLQADEAFVCNSLIGLWPIRRIETTDLSIGPITRLCRMKLDEWLGKATL